MITESDALFVNPVISSVKNDAHLASGQASDQDEPLSPEGEVEGSMLESLDQRKPGELYPEEKKQGWETDMEFMGQQKETFQVLIHTDLRVCVSLTIKLN